MAESLVKRGFCITENLEDADAIIINTCSFIQAATEESIDEILDMIEAAKAASRHAFVVVAGCLPARYGEDLAQELPEVAAFVPCASEKGIADVLEDMFAHRDGVPPLQDCASKDVEESREQREHTKGHTFAYVKISDGCDRWCSYCTIPLIRGRYHSFTYEDIAKDVESQIARGAKEIVLIAQDTSRWGEDFEGNYSLASLIDHLAKAYPDTWFRVMYIQPEGITDELLSVMQQHDHVAPYLDIPLQHIDEDILRLMNRKGSKESFEQLFSRIHEKLPHAVLRTTLIAGFPQESEEQFDQLVEFAGEGIFDYVGVFLYSREEGTKAFLLEGQIDEDEKEYRAQTLRTLCDAVSSQLINERIGKTYPVLIEGVEEDGQRYGRALIQAPEVDGVTYVDRGDVGEIVNVRIEDTFLYDMEGVVV